MGLLTLKKENRSELTTVMYDYIRGNKKALKICGVKDKPIILDLSYYNYFILSGGDLDLNLKPSLKGSIESDKPTRECFKYNLLDLVCYFVNYNQSILTLASENGNGLETESPLFRFWKKRGGGRRTKKRKTRKRKTRKRRTTKKRKTRKRRTTKRRTKKRKTRKKRTKGRRYR